MLKALIYILICLIAVYVVVNYNSAYAKNRKQQQNHVPVVKIVSPKNNSNFAPGVQVNYSVTVSDKEDGDSKFDEINIKQVLMQVKYISDESKLAALVNRPVENDPPGLTVMRLSNCFNCHGFDNKVIGPSFNDINKRYKPSADNIALLEKRIRDGSKGVWGKESMPSHPELKKEEIQNIVKWMMQNADANETWYVGTEGAIKLPVSEGGKNGIYLLTASYTDHGAKDGTGTNLKGQDVVVIRSK